MYTHTLSHPVSLKFRRLWLGSCASPNPPHASPHVIAISTNSY